MIIYGKNPVLETLKTRPREINKILISKSASGENIKQIVDMAKAASIPYTFIDIQKLDKLSNFKNHQGVAAMTLAKEYVSLEDIMLNSKKTDKPVICLLDEITDPQNLGAILRNACFFGIMGIIIPKRNSAGLTEAVAKISSGALEYVPVAQVSNIVYAIDKLKEEGFWIAGADSNDGKPVRGADVPKPVAVVLGSEGTGLGRLVRQKCDFLLKIPPKDSFTGNISSLNVASASAIIFYELSRPRE
ncbi:MAG: 23S rRNA (guanosine(2251)-2'-O)-methyltransferase RlmB [Elusimicrobia bacterium RIFOXYB2_FULL_48_7]|nr:MAG: 23S rRNA (guanosine(2251)-2'-O)-methyltransferase RlmB [Elusimicrobia bacterium RIFOXYB2_FULL_48_7]